MSYFDLNDDVKSIIAKHLSNDMNMDTMFMSNHGDFQKLLFGEIVFDNDFNKIRKHLIVFLMMMILITVKYIRYLMF